MGHAFVMNATNQRLHDWGKICGRSLFQIRGLDRGLGHRACPKRELRLPFRCFLEAAIDNRLPLDHGVKLAAVSKVCMRHDTTSTLPTPISKHATDPAVQKMVVPGGIHPSQPPTLYIRLPQPRSLPLCQPDDIP